MIASMPWRATRGTAVSSAVFTTGRPAAMASSWTRPKVSALVTDGMTKTSARHISLMRSLSLHRTEQADAVTEAELADQLLEPRPLGAFADDPDLELAVDGGADQDVKALVGHEPAAGEHEPAAIVDVVRLDLRPVVTRGVDAERHDVAFVDEFPQQRRVLDQRRGPRR